jgi:hypothetical protein
MLVWPTHQRSSIAPQIVAVPLQELGEMAYAPRGQDALAVQQAKLKQDNYAEFLFSKEFKPLVA